MGVQETMCGCTGDYVWVYRRLCVGVQETMCGCTGDYVVGVQETM